jgi:hypothetical protein
VEQLLDIIRSDLLQEEPEPEVEQEGEEEENN